MKEIKNYTKKELKEMSPNDIERIGEQMETPEEITSLIDIMKTIPRFFGLRESLEDVEIYETIDYLVDIRNNLKTQIEGGK